MTFADLETAPAVLLVGLEAEEEAGITFLRLRKGVVARTHARARRSRRWRAAGSSG